MWRLPAILFAILLIEPATGHAASVVIGDCNQINQNIKVGEGATLNIVNDCVPPKPEDSFTVSFYWVDSLSLSLLIAGHTDEYMKAILSSGPIVLKNAVYDNITEILRRFGERPVVYGGDEEEEHKASDPGFARFPIYTPRIVARNEMEQYREYSLSDIPTAILNKLRIYDGEAKIIWPDLSAFDSFYQSSKWPAGYNMTYRVNGEETPPISVSDLDLARELRNRPNATARFLLECSSVYKLVQKSEFDEYWTNLQKLIQRIKTTENGENLYAHEPSSDIKYAEPGSRSNLNSYEALKYFTREGWPTDFLVARGHLEVEQCGASAGFELAAIPRDLFALVAVVKPKTSGLRIKGILYKEDAQTALRTQLNPTDDLVVDDELPAIGRNQSFVIPLRLELRYNLDNFSDITDEPDPDGLYQQFQPIADREIAIDPKIYFKDSLVDGPAATADEGYSEDYSVDLPAVRKDISAFYPPQSTAITQTYVFGEALDLVGLRVPEGIMKVRKTPRYALLSEGGFDGASCPFVYFREADGELSLKGRVLVGADSPSRFRIEEVNVPIGARATVLMEKEPEITFLSKVEYRSGSKDEWVLLSAALDIGPGETVELKLPETAKLGALLRISGYYRTLNSYLYAKRNGQIYPEQIDLPR